MAKITKLDLDQLVTADDRTYVATWSFKESHLDSFTVSFQYYTQSSDVKKNSKGKVTREWIWINGSETTTKSKQAIYTAPEYASKVRVRVKPTSTKTKVVNKKQTYWWTGAWSKYITADVAGSYVPDSPDTPTVTVSSNDATKRITATCENLDSIVETVEFEFVINDKSSKKVTVKVSRAKASYVLTGAAGTKYRVRARADNIVTKTIKKKKKKFQYWSEWSAYSDNYETQPIPPTSLKCSVKSETSVLLSWVKPTTAKSYEIQYATTLAELQYQSGSTFKSITSTTVGCIISDLDSGQRWYFRVRALNADGVESTWSSTVNTILGSSPAAPTTWSSSSTVSLGDSVNLYWVHNSEDGSSQVQANIQVMKSGKVVLDTVVKNSKDSSGEYSDETSIYKLSTSNFKDNDELLWRIRTMGITSKYGDWSVQRSIKLYDKPSLHMDVLDGVNGNPVVEISHFPLYIKGVALPRTQKSIGYSVSIIALTSYATTEETGTPLYINEGDEIYSTYVDVSGENLSLTLTAGDVDFENGAEYAIRGVVAMDSGLNAEDETQLAVAWEDETYNIDAVVSYNPDDLTAYIMPYCTVQRADDDTTTDTTEDEDAPNPDDELDLVTGVTLSVYRREANGKFKAIATGVENSGAATVTDPHPSLDFARYRIVAISEATGALSYEDLPGYPTGENSIVIQWGEEWMDFDSSNEELDETTWRGSMVKIPYNVDVSEQNRIDAALVEYIGRERPVSYYGTQLGENPSWACVIPKDDTDTLHLLRCLAAYPGDVYVREPSGTGFWAQISVSFNNKHTELTIPVTFDIRPVEGGI